MTLNKYKVEKNLIEENKTWPQYLVVLTALMAMFCSGISFGWPSPSLPKIFSEEYPFNVTQEEGSYITIIAPIGGIAGNILTSLLMDSIGRKITIMLIGMPQIISMAMIYCSTYSVILLYIARFIGGMSEGACYTVLPIYVCEVTVPKIRGVLGSSFSLSIIAGVLFANIVGSYFTIYTAALIFLSCSVIFLISFSSMPESPYYLIMKERIESARLSLRKLRGRDNVEEELSTLIDDVGRQMSEKGTFKDLFIIQSNKVACIVMIVLRLLQQFCGVSSFMFYAQILIKDATDAIPEDLAATIMMVVQLCFTALAVSIVDKVGRRPMILISVGGCCVTLIFNFIFFGIRDWSSVDVSDVTLLPVVVLLLFMIFFAMGLGSAVNLLMGELFPATVKAKASCFMSIVFSAGMFASTKFYQYTTDNYSIAIPFLVFGICQFVGFILCWRYVPETMHKSLEQIQQELKGTRTDEKT